MTSAWSTISLDVDVEYFRCSLTRLDDQSYFDMRKSSLPIQVNLAFMRMFQVPQSDNAVGRLNLAELYTVFKIRFGKSGNCYDDWKSAFAFPFKLEIFRGDACYFYLLEFINRRSTFEFNFRKVLQPEETKYNREAYHKPFEDELSASDMHALLTIFYGYAEVFLESIRDNSIKEFVRRVPSDQILFGYWQKQFFTQQYKDNVEFRTVYEEMQHTIKQKYIQQI